MITGLISIDHIMHALNCDGISEHDKMLYIQLLNTLYIQAASLGPNPKTVLPAILVWKGEHKVLKDE